MFWTTSKNALKKNTINVKLDANEVTERHIICSSKGEDEEINIYIYITEKKEKNIFSFFHILFFLSFFSFFPLFFLCPHWMELVEPQWLRSMLEYSVICPHVCQLKQLFALFKIKQNSRDFILKTSKPLGSSVFLMTLTCCNFQVFPKKIFKQPLMTNIYYYSK
jgi:hypothetical protein